MGTLTAMGGGKIGRLRLYPVEKGIIAVDSWTRTVQLATAHCWNRAIELSRENAARLILDQRQKVRQQARLDRAITNSMRIVTVNKVVGTKVIVHANDDQDAIAEARSIINGATSEDRSAAIVETRDTREIVSFCVEGGKNAITPRRWYGTNQSGAAQRQTEQQKIEIMADALYSIIKYDWRLKHCALAAMSALTAVGLSIVPPPTHRI